MNNLGIVISFIIGGLLIISILTLNARVIQNSGETVLNMSAKQSVENITEIMRRDFQRIGYNMATGTNPIQVFTSNRIIFWADIDNDKSTNAKMITWQFNKPGNPVHATENPNDYELVRTISGSTKKFTFPLVEFELSYYDSEGDIATNASEIRTISVALQSQSPQTYRNNEYSSSFWEKTFSPPNLKLQDIEW